MSYEGYEQYWCAKGHYYVGPDSRHVEEPGMAKCPHCDSEAVFMNAVDETNCDSWGLIRPREITPAVFETCNLGHKHLAVAATHEIPNEECRKIATYEGCYCPPGVVCDNDYHRHNAPPMRCRYSDCRERHPVAGEDEKITCSNCRNYLGLPSLLFP